VAVYDRASGNDFQARCDELTLRHTDCAERGDFRAAAFFALDRPKEGAIPIYRTSESEKSSLTTDQPPNARGRPVEPLFWALPADHDSDQTVPLYKYVSETGLRTSSTRDDLTTEGFNLANKPLCRVWPSPWRLSRKAE
jgi:hypothetical protein